MNDVSYLERVMVMLGCLELIVWLCCPSVSRSILFGFCTSTVRLEVAGKTIGWKSVSGHIGVRTNAFTSGSSTGPLAEKE